MNKYRDKSDFEINKAVAIAVGFPCYYGNSNGHYTNGIGLRAAIVKGKDVHGNYMMGSFDPCNNPSDAWPIIFKNRISVIIPGVEYSDGYSAPFAASGFDDVSHITKNTYYTDEESFNQNPLSTSPYLKQS